MCPQDKAAREKLADCERELRKGAFKNAMGDMNREKEQRSQREQKSADIRSNLMMAPLSWTTTEIPKLVDMCAQVIAKEVKDKVEGYMESLVHLPGGFLKHIANHLPWQTFQRLRQNPAYSKLAVMNLSEKFKQLTLEEDHYRGLFANKRLRNHQSVRDPHLMLVDVHRDADLFRREVGDEEMEAIPRLFVGAKRRGSAIAARDEFLENFNVFTEGQLTNLDWNNVFVAGGSVLACLMPAPPFDLKEYYHCFAYKSSDIDLFVYGLSPEAANKKVAEIYHAVQAHCGVKLVAFRTLHTITLVSEFPRRHIQIILRLYSSPAEILMGFDIDCCAVGFDGLTVYAHPRACRALKYGFNLVDITRRSPTYESRLHKYAKRGFEVAVPGFDRSRVKQDSQKKFWGPRPGWRGLAKLLSLEQVHNR